MTEDAPAPRVFLVGMMGSGKSTVGRELARQTGWPYLDNDQLVRTMTGREPAEIRTTDGEDVLHVAETEALDSAFALRPPVVIGAAAAVVDDPAAREALREGGHVVWLRARVETLLDRVGSGEGRRAEATDPTWVRQHLREREPLYASVASQILDVDEIEPATIARAIIEAVQPL